MFFGDSILSAASLAMDALAVSICIGAGTPGVGTASAIRMAAACGGLQFIMPVIGHALGISVLTFISSFDHWIAFALLALVGGNMIRESFGPRDECVFASDPTKGLSLLTIAVATSIDALAVGASFAMSERPVMPLAIAAGVITALLCVAGVVAGEALGSRLGRRTELAGGVVLIAIGANILREHIFG